MIIYSIFYFVFFFLFKKKIPKFFFILYGIIFLSSLLFDTGFSGLNEYALKPINMIVFVLSIIIMLLPLNSIEFNDIFNVNLSIKKIKQIAFVFGFCGSLSAIYFTPFALTVSLNNADSIRNSLGSGNSVLPNTIFNYIFTAFSQLYIFYLYFYFVALKKNIGNVYKFLLLIASLSYIVNSVVFAARDGYVIYVISLITFLLYTGNNQIFKIKNFLLLVPFGYLILSITISRFGDIESKSFLVGTLGYIGQQPYVFNEALTKNIEFYGADLRFPLFSSNETPPLRSNTFERMFGTWLLDLYMVKGYLSLFLGLLIFNLLPKYIKIIRRRTSLGSNLLKIIYLQYLIQGLFYFRSGNLPGNIILVFIVVTSLILFFITQKNKTF